MNKSTSHLKAVLALCLLSFPVIAAEPPRELLWPNGAPGAGGSDPANDQPALTIYSPPEGTGNGTAVVICPGGGYRNLAMGHEGHDIATWLNGMGITGVVLEYRMSRGGYQHPIPLMDAQRALRTIRFRAEELNLDPNRIGILGFSAGGHLASTAGTHFDTGNPNADDPVERVGCRPDFMILCYPVIALGETYTHKGSQRNLIGENPPQELINSLSNEKQVTAHTPPTFLFHTDEDTSVPPENSVVFYLALRKAGVPAELHIYQNGRHGRGLAQNIQGTSGWPEACKQWLLGQGMIDATSDKNPHTRIDQGEK
jgi:acetyl esterase/lipase